MSEPSGTNETLCIIPARGGSKGVKRKNLRPLCGVPLIEYSVRHALSAPLVHRTVVSTDDDEIAGVTLRLGAGVVARPPELSGDTATSESALLHALEHLERAEGYRPRLVVFLQATSPLRRAGSIDAAVRTLLDQKCDSVFSACASHEFLWRLRAGVPEAINYDPARRPRRQDMAPQYRENGSIFVTRTDVLRTTGNRLGGRTGVFEMSALESFQIDTEDDFTLMEALLWVHPELGGGVAHAATGASS